MVHALAGTHARTPARDDDGGPRRRHDGLRAHAAYAAAR